MKRFAWSTLLLAAAVVSAQDNMPPRVVKVTGTADVKVVPDRAVIDIGVEKQNVSATAAKKLADTAARGILASLRKNGIDEKDIQTTFLSLEPQYDYRTGRTTYFIASQTLTVTVRDLTELDLLLEALIKSGGNRISSIQYQTSESRKYRDQARDLAAKAAREKAQDLAKALGQSIGKAYLIEEVPQSNYSYAFGGLMANAIAEEVPTKSRAGGPATATGERTVAASVNVWFELQ